MVTLSLLQLQLLIMIDPGQKVNMINKTSADGFQSCKNPVV